MPRGGHHIYIDERFVGDQKVDQSHRNRCYEILSRHYEDLPEKARVEFDFVRDEMRREHESIRLWAYAFKAAFFDGRPLPDRRQFGATHSDPASRAKGLEDMTSFEKALYAVLDAGHNGVTSLEARRFEEKGGGISGALTKMHQAGVIERLERQR